MIISLMVHNCGVYSSVKNMLISLGVVLLCKDKMWSYREKHIQKRTATQPCKVSTEEMLGEQKAKQQTQSETENMKVYDLKDREDALAQPDTLGDHQDLRYYVEMMLLQKKLGLLLKFK